MRAGTIPPRFETRLKEPVISEFNYTHVRGDLRVQMLSATLVRLERRGPKGFEDRETFNVVDRDWPGVKAEVRPADGGELIVTEGYQVFVPVASTTPAGVEVRDPRGRMLFGSNGVVPEAELLPGPSETIEAWCLSDFPRVVPPEWGATPPPARAGESPTSGWDIENDAVDVYVFVPGAGGYRQLRRDVLKLTGPTPLPPIWALGLMTSRYHPYNERSALDVIDTFRARDIPLDVFVLDTDWRVGASHGYGVNEDLFPDMPRFLDACHQRRVNVMFNDHPEPAGPGALSPEELGYRDEGLGGLLDMGLDAWWYDRNWGVSLEAPLPGLRHDLWGMRLYHDITARHKQGLRPMVMSNSMAASHGRRYEVFYPAEHRYPIWWTGDQDATWKHLRAGVHNLVDLGVRCLIPYLSDDLGGHVGGPGDELYVRYCQFGALSSLMRLHCTRGETRDPWAYGQEAERIVADYVRLRYRLLPTLYAASREALEDASPVCRRCDLFWPEEPEAIRPDQYVLGDDLLVAPPTVPAEAARGRALPAGALKASDGSEGMDSEYFDNVRLRGAVVATETAAARRFDPTLRELPEPRDADRSPQSHYGARRRARLGPFDVAGRVKLTFEALCRVRVIIDGREVINRESDYFSGVEAATQLDVEPGETFELVVEHGDRTGDPELRISWHGPGMDVNAASRDVWVPPGTWQDLWSGRRIEGPRMISTASPLPRVPMLARVGGIVLALPEAPPETSQPWDRIVANIWLPRGDSSQSRLLYEDDGVSTQYQQGRCRKTPVTFKREGGRCRLEIGPVEGEYPAAGETRAWLIRVHLPESIDPERFIDEISTAPVTDVTIREPVDRGDMTHMPFKGGCGEIGCHVAELSLAQPDVAEPVVVAWSAGS